MRGDHREPIHQTWLVAVLLLRTGAPKPLPQRSRRKNFRTAPTRRSGASMAAKCPPRSNSDQCTMWLPSSAKRRIGMSSANTATPVGTVEGGRPVARVRTLVVQLGRRRSCSGQPVKHHVGEHPVPVYCLLRQLGRGVSPLLELLHDPGELPSG